MFAYDWEVDVKMVTITAINVNVVYVLINSPKPGVLLVPCIQYSLNNVFPADDHDSMVSKALMNNLQSRLQLRHACRQLLKQHKPIIW